MYYRYKTRKKDKRYLRYFLYLIIAASTCYILYHYRNHLMFWKISHNRIVSEIKSVSGTTDPAMRIEKLRKLKNDLEIYKSENQLEPESYTFTARVCYALGISGKGSYTDIYLKESGINLSPESEKFLT